MNNTRGKKTINGYPFVKHNVAAQDDQETILRSKAFYHAMSSRRSVREFSDRAIPEEVIDTILMTASTAPSGAHKQPWTFCVIKDPAIKKKIREEAEKEEYESYNGRMPAEWLHDLAPFQTDWQKAFLEIAPYLIIVFKKAYDVDPLGKKRTNYYVQESVGIACGFLLAAIHQAGLVALTHTPSPMNFLARILERPENERPFLLIPVGYAVEETFVPDIQRKSLAEIVVKY